MGTAETPAAACRAADTEVMPRHVTRSAHDLPRGMEYGNAHVATDEATTPDAGEAGDAVDTRGLNGLGEGHRRQNGGEAPGQHRLARPGRTKQEDIMVTTPASASASPEALEVPMVMP